MSVKFGLPPIARDDIALFILGSLPGDASLAAARYYAHPTNQFWRLVGTVISEELHSLDYEARLARLADHRIGLWDVVAFAERRGSLDQAIRGAGHNAIDQLARHFPCLRAIAFNGGAAAKAGRRLIGDPAGLALLDLPSSSAANTMPFAAKAQIWARLAEFIPAAQSDGR